MIRYNPKSWFTLIFHSYSRFVIRSLLPALLFMGLFSAAVCYIILDYFDLDRSHYQGTTVFHSLMGIVLGLFLVFRVNSAYDRWWEGRKLWGALVNSTRNFALKLNAYLSPGDEKIRKWFGMMIPNFVFAMKEHLRSGVVPEELEVPDESFVASLSERVHKPNFISSLMYKEVNTLRADQKLSPEQFFVLDKEMKDFIDILGACERIRATPVPYSYSMYLKKFIFAYIITLPFGFVTSFEYFTILIVTAISYILLSVELIAEEIEDPFGRDPNDLPTDELSVKIRENVKEILLSR